MVLCLRTAHFVSMLQRGEKTETGEAGVDEGAVIGEA
jgi:hypothetical protein